MIVDVTRLNWKRDLSMDNIQRIFSTIGDNFYLKLLAGTACSVNDFVFHPRHDAVVIVLALVLLDTSTGLLKAIRSHTVSSSGFFRCMTKMVVYTIMMSVSALLDKITSLDTVISALSVCSVFLSVTESLSSLENISALGFSTPKKLIDMLRFAQGQIGGDDSGPKKP